MGANHFHLSYSSVASHIFFFYIGCKFCCTFCCYYYYSYFEVNLEIATSPHINYKNTYCLTDHYRYLATAKLLFVFWCLPLRFLLPPQYNGANECCLWHIRYI